jgi:hypothetical protein
VRTSVSSEELNRQPPKVVTVKMEHKDKDGNMKTLITRYITEADGTKRIEKNTI